MRLLPLLRQAVLVLLAYSIVCVCSVAMAQVYVPPSPVSWGDVVRSSETDSGGSLGVELLWLRPTSTKLLYMVADPYRTGNIRGTLKGLQHSYAPAFRLIGATGMGKLTGLELAFTHCKSSQDNAAEREGQRFWGLLLHPNSVIDDDDVTKILATTTFILDEGSLGSRVSFAFGSSGNVSLSAGLLCTRMKQEMRIIYQEKTTPALERNVVFTRENTLCGCGPSFSVGTMWNMAGINLFGELGAAMLVSSIGGHVQQHDFDYNAVKGTLRVDVECEYGPRIVPAASMRLGLGYEGRHDWGLFSVRLGYEVRNYFNSISTYEQYDDVDAQVGANDQSDIGINGFFLAIKGRLAFSIL